MDKLIELLQEYLNSEVFKKDISWNDNIEDIPDVKVTRCFGDKFYCTYISDTEFEIPTDTVIGKRYRFIKWFVDNDKIETKKLEKIWYEKTVYGYDWQYREIVEYSDYEALLMLLSIQDDPIEFLVNILK